MHNPVDWYPWGEEAFARARAEDRPILLSVGYSACHWCHVMERESFEDEATAAKMNGWFVNVKVDREERPDVDHIYQTAVQLMRRSGGWPLTCFLTPDGRPFFAGTYFPDQPRYGMPAFSQVLERLHEVWTEQRDEVLGQAQALADALRRVDAVEAGGGGMPDPELPMAAAEALLERVDRTWGGFGGAPKFPSPTNLWTLWRAGVRGRVEARDAVLLTLRRMAEGGVYDQLGGGYHRYSTDEEWLVPHFEKMLYDNAQLASLGFEAWRVCAHGDGPRNQADELLRVTSETLAWMADEMRGPEGMFHAATDADSEGEEGVYFVWTPAAVAAELDDPAVVRSVCAWYDVTPQGNWEGRSILRRRRTAAEVARELGISEATLAAHVAAARPRLLAARARREPPFRDDKRIVSWNALAIQAFVDGWRATGRADWLQVARGAADAVLDTLVVEGRLLHSFCDGDRRGPGFLDDHAALGLALLHLHEATGTLRYRDAALALAVALEGWFQDPDGGWYMTPSDGETLVHRPRDNHDSAVPSGSALAAAFLLRLHAHTGEERWLGQVEAALRVHGEALGRNPFGVGLLLGVVETWSRGFDEVVLAEGDVFLPALGRVPGADRVVLRLEALPPEHPAAGGRRPDGPTAWLCRGRSCSLPVHTPEALVALLKA